MSNKLRKYLTKYSNKIILDGEFYIYSSVFSENFDSLIRELNEELYGCFDGIYKEFEYCVVTEFGYMTIRPIKETLR